MPYYDYICRDCNTKVQVKASMSEKEAGLKVSCSKCGSTRTEQVFTSISVGGRSPAPFACPSSSGRECFGPGTGPGCGCDDGF